MILINEKEERHFLNYFDKIVKFAKLLVEILCLIFIILIFILGRKDPFNNQTIEEIYNYFYCYPPNEFLDIPIDYDTIYRNDTEYNINSDIGIQSSETAIYEPYRTFFKCEGDFDTTKASFCRDIYSSLARHKGDKFSFIFVLNYDSIKTFSLANLFILSCIIICKIEFTVEKFLRGLKFINSLIWIAK